MSKENHRCVIKGADLALERVTSLHVVLHIRSVVGGARGGGQLLVHRQERLPHSHRTERSIAL